MFNVTSKEYTVVFTSGCTASLKLLADCFLFTECSTQTGSDHPPLALRPTSSKQGTIEKGRFCFTEDNHTSVVGMTSIFRHSEVQCVCLGQREVDIMELINKGTVGKGETSCRPMCVCGQKDEQYCKQNIVSLTSSRVGLNLRDSQFAAGQCHLKYYSLLLQEMGDAFLNITKAEPNQLTEEIYPRNLFIYPLQSNFNGRKYNARWVELAHTGRLFCGRGKWLVGLDAASYVSTSALDLTQVPADFIALSFYKIFGFPTGLGEHFSAFG